MPSLFEEFSQNDPEYINMNLVETDAQRSIRNNFELMTDNNRLIIDMFDPAEDQENRAIHLVIIDDEYKEEEPELQLMLLQNMLRSLNLEAPESFSDSRYIFKRPSSKGCEFIFRVDREDGTYLPVYTRVNSIGVPLVMKLYTYDSVGKALEILEYQNELIEKINVTKKDLQPLNYEQLKGFYNAFDSIRNLPTIEES